MSDESEICTCCDDESQPQPQPTLMGVADVLGVCYLVLLALLIVGLTL